MEAEVRQCVDTKTVVLVVFKVPENTQSFHHVVYKR
jgi:hypothetical protein